VDSTRPYQVAIKKITNVLLTPVHALRALRELRLLRFTRHGCVVTLLDAFMPPGSGDLYLVMPLLDYPLPQTRAPAPPTVFPVGMTADQICFLVYQLARALKVAVW
jgi:serine/threonine protein kinase